MTLFISYNFPIDQCSATVSLGMGNVEDANFLFRVGVIEKPKVKEIRWVIPEWKTLKQTEKVKLIVTRNNLVILERKNIKNNSITRRNKIDINFEWPANATGGTTMDVTYLI